jgi:flavin reductase (DIM6/NTAB) family NADH-FMN oxidoreductase RutF
MIRGDDKLLARRFAGHIPPDELGDPFDSLEVETMWTGAPLLKRCRAAFDCEVVRHFDLEADHELYVGQIVGACIYDR